MQQPTADQTTRVAAPCEESADILLEVRALLVLMDNRRHASSCPLPVALCLEMRQEKIDRTVDKLSARSVRASSHVARLVLCRIT